MLLQHTHNALWLVLATGSQCTSAQGLPIIDLGISVHQAQLNGGGQFYSFRNIPYAEPPLGKLRFRNPIPLLSINRTINDGSSPRACLQASPGWFQYSIPLVFQKLAERGIFPPPGPPPPGPAGESEDCLVLDVSVPKDVYDARVAGTLLKKIPVVLWIHGGAYVGGSKDINAAGFIASSRRNGAPGIVFVSINYRLGLFGFPPRKPWMLDVASNAGLYDQRLAMEWVRLNIGRFGGDFQDVTVIGESAGAGSIVSHITAFLGIDGTSPFNKAIIQSPAIKPFQDATLQAQLYDQFLAVAGVTSIADARAQSSAELATANAIMVGTAPFASSVFGPNVDGVFTRDHPGKLLAAGQVDKQVKAIVAHNLDEGLLFTDPRITDEAGFKAYLAGLMPSLPAAKINVLASQIYPPDFSGTVLPYTDQIGRTKLAISEGLINCFSFGTNLAYANQSRSYQFSAFPGLHATDVSYTFYNAGDVVDGFGVPLSVPTAQLLQWWLTDFAALGYGAGSTASQIPVYTSLANVANVTEAGQHPTVKDPAANARCRYWLTGLTS
ncbi:carboxylesterase family protein-like protein, partial [Podospora didyma]